MRLGGNRPVLRIARPRLQTARRVSEKGLGTTPMGRSSKITRTVPSGRLAVSLYEANGQPRAGRFRVATQGGKRRRHAAALQPRDSGLGGT